MGKDMGSRFNPNHFTQPNNLPPLSSPANQNDQPMDRDCGSQYGRMVVAMPMEHPGPEPQWDEAYRKPQHHQNNWKKRASGLCLKAHCEIGYFCILVFVRH